MDLITGNYYDNIKCESFLAPTTNPIIARYLITRRIYESVKKKPFEWYLLSYSEPFEGCRSPSEFFS